MAVKAEKAQSWGTEAENRPPSSWLSETEKVVESRILRAAPSMEKILMKLFYGELFDDYAKYVPSFSFSSHSIFGVFLRMMVLNIHFVTTIT